MTATGIVTTTGTGDGIATTTTGRIRVTTAGTTHPTAITIRLTGRTRADGCGTATTGCSCRSTRPAPPGRALPLEWACRGNPRQAHCVRNEKLPPPGLTQRSKHESSRLPRVRRAGARPGGGSHDADPGPGRGVDPGPRLRSEAPGPLGLGRPPGAQDSPALLDRLRHRGRGCGTRAGGDGAGGGDAGGGEPEPLVWCLRVVRGRRGLDVRQVPDTGR